jgi:hypothetical protein
MSSKNRQSASAERKHSVRLLQNVVELDQPPGIWWGNNLIRSGFKTSDQVRELKVPKVTKVKASLRSIFYNK